MKILSAYLIAPLTAPALYFVYFLFGTGMNEILSKAILVFALTAPVSYLATAILGIPTYLVLKKLNRLSISSLALLGFIQGIFVIQFASMVYGDSGRIVHLKDLFAFIFVGGSFGLSVSALFGYLAGLTLRSSGTPQKRGAP